MDERFTYFLLAIPAVCVFWFLYAILITEIANWLNCHRLRNDKPTASAELPQQKPSNTMRGFDYLGAVLRGHLAAYPEIKKRMRANSRIDCKIRRVCRERYCLPRGVSPGGC